jgi:hypothetical protein
VLQLIRELTRGIRSLNTSDHHERAGFFLIPLVIGKPSGGQQRRAA